jgi:glyoxylase-like metal-dependent hydrolase (beta-lactamase superfamily II)
MPKLSVRDAGPYRLYTILYAESPPSRRAQHNFMSAVDFHDVPMPLDFYCWVAVSGDRICLIDSGCDKETCDRRGHIFHRSIIEGLADLGLRAEDVSDVIVTHMHWDHLGNLEHFPNARIHVHKAEMAHATGCSMCHEPLRRPYDVEQICVLLRALYAGRVSFTSQAAEILPGLSIHPVGGHAPGLQIVEVSTARGKVVLASDAMHFYANGALSNPYPVVVDVREYLDGLRLLERLAESPDHIIPGHDPELRNRFPAVNGVSGIWEVSLPPVRPSANTSHP